MRDHGNAHALELALIGAGAYVFDHFVVVCGGPIDADEIAVGEIARLLPMPRQAAIRAIGAAAFGIGHQQVQAMGAGGAIHLTGIKPSVIAAAVLICTYSGERIAGVLT